MKTSTKRSSKIQPVYDLPLFSWRVVILRPATAGGQFVARRYRVHPEIADAVALFAGIASTGD